MEGKGSRGRELCLAHVTLKVSDSLYTGAKAVKCKEKIFI